MLELMKYLRCFTICGRINSQQVYGIPTHGPLIRSELEAGNTASCVVSEGGAKLQAICMHFIDK